MIRFPGTFPVAVAVLAYLYVPIVILVALSFNASPLITLWEGFSLHWYGAAARDGAMRLAIGNSLSIAIVAMVLATVLATMAALALPSRGRPQAALRGLIGLPLIVPEIVVAIAILMAFVLAGIRLGLPAMMAAHAMLALPFAYLPIRTRLDDLDPALAEAASDLYAAPWRVFRQVTLPLIWPGIASGAMLAFVVSLGDFTVSFFLAAPGATTLPVYVYGMIRTGLTPAVNAVSTALVLLSVGLLALSQVAARGR